jgi:hypothetical protein
VQPDRSLITSRLATITERFETEVVRVSKLLQEAFAAGAFRTDLRFAADWRGETAEDATREALRRGQFRDDIAWIAESEELRRSTRITVYWSLHRR